ncbi:MAG: hypothetical protein R3E31_19245 [Chloroflexota bacterium]
MNEFPPILHQAAMSWAREYYQTEQIFIMIIREEDDEPGRYLALIAAANQNAIWQAAEVWLEDGEVVAVNDLGEGLPPEGISWPW